MKYIKLIIQKIWEIATQIISSLNQLYTSGITVHSDHRPEKVLLTSDLKVKLGIVFIIELLKY